MFMEQHDLLSNDLLINSTSQINLATAAKWGKFLAIVGFVFCGFMVIGGIAATALLSSSSQMYDTGFLKYMGLIYVVLAAILFVPCLYLLKFSNKTQEAVRASSQESLDTAFANLKSLFKFYGIFTIVILVIYALAFLGGMGTLFMR
jgi:hypothetical protein